MQTRSKTSCCIDRRAVEKGSRPPVMTNQAGIEKLATVLASSENKDLDGHLNKSKSIPSPLNSPPKKPTKAKREKWTREDYREVMYAFYLASKMPSEGLTKDSYRIWRERNVGKRAYLDANKFSNVRRQILRNNLLTPVELEEIRQQVNIDIEDMNDQNPVVREEGVNEIENILERQPKVAVNMLSMKEVTETISDVQAGKYSANNLQKEPEIPSKHNVQDDLVKEVHLQEITETKTEILNEYMKIKQTKMQDREQLLKISRNNQNKKMINIGNKALERILNECTIEDMTALNELTYATAKVIERQCLPNRKKKKATTHKKPAWKLKIEKEIEAMRGEISILDELSRGNNVKSRKGRKVKRKYKLKSLEDIPPVKETLKQKVTVKAQRLRRFEKRSKFYSQNRVFQTDPKRFYREVGKKPIEVKNIPKEEELEGFWRGIWSTEKQHNEKAVWLKDTEDLNRGKMKQEWQDITSEELSEALKKTHKWKSPGMDKVPNFWLEALNSSHRKLLIELNVIMADPKKTPEWMATGVTYLLPKAGQTDNPKNYRLITCLSTVYKILTSILTERTYTFMEQNELFPLEQKGCKRGSYGCKDQLLINKMILENCRNRHKNLSTAWIDYKKAFDSVPHSWILKSLEIFNISPTIINFLKHNMSLWNTTLFLSHCDGVMKSNNININCGIFQGDSFSPLLFCLSLIPLSLELNKTKYGYKIRDKLINHLFYMDDLKLYAKNDGELEGLLKTVKKFSDDIGMEFGLDKCAKATFKGGKMVKSEFVHLDMDTVIKSLDQEDVYKYLGVNEGNGIQHSSMKEKIRKECYRRVRALLKSELNAQNRITAINTLAIPVVSYSFNIINWNMSELRKIDTKIRKLMTSNRMHHPKADKDRLYLPRIEGGRGMIQLELSYKTATIALQKYISSSKDWMLNLVNEHEKSKRAHSVSKESAKFIKQFNMQHLVNNDAQDLPPTVQAKKIRQTAKKEGQKQLNEKWEDKPLHGQYPLRSKQADVDKKHTHQWLRSSGLKAESEGLILAAQDQSLMTRNFEANVLKNGANPSCRLCDKAVETVDHLVAGCSVLAPTEYKARHDRVGQYLHWNICKHYNIKTEANWYEHHPKPVTEGDRVTILWDFPINTDRTIKANRPDIVIKDHKNEFCYLIDMSVPSDNNVAAKTFEKVSKYTDLEIEIQKMWTLKTTTIPVICGALGMIKKGADKYLNQIPGNNSLSEVQKIVLTSTCHTLRRVLSM